MPPAVRELERDSHTRAGLALPKAGTFEARDGDAVGKDETTFRLSHRAETADIHAQMDVLREKRLYTSPNVEAEIGFGSVTVRRKMRGAEMP